MDHGESRGDAGEFKGRGTGAAEPSDPFIVLTQDTAENLSLSVVPQKNANMMGTKYLHTCAIKNEFFSLAATAFPQRLPQTSTCHTHTLHTPTGTHARRGEESAQCRDWVVQNHCF